MKHTAVSPPQKKRGDLAKRFRKYKYYYPLIIPGMLLFILFNYVPLYGVLIAFKDYKLLQGVFGSPWAGMKWFEILFTSTPDFWPIMRNTILISFYKLIFDFPAPIILALLLNEVRNIAFKRTVQTIIYMPHFLNWIVLGGIFIQLLSVNTGILGLLGFSKSPLIDENKFRSVLVISSMWKNAGWGTIIYLAAITGINPELYEAAVIDGANRLQQVFYITIPCILSTVVTLLILRSGHILSAGFEQIYVLYSPLVYSTGDVLDTYVYRVGLSLGRYSFATAAGLFKSVVGLIVIIFTNWLAKRMGEEGVW